MAILVKGYLSTWQSSELDSVAQCLCDLGIPSIYYSFNGPDMLQYEFVDTCSVPMSTHVEQLKQYFQKYSSAHIYLIGHSLGGLITAAFMYHISNDESSMGSQLLDQVAGVGLLAAPVRLDGANCLLTSRDNELQSPLWEVLETYSVLVEDIDPDILRRTVAIHCAYGRDYIARHEDTCLLRLERDSGILRWDDEIGAPAGHFSLPRYVCSSLTVHLSAGSNERDAHDSQINSRE